MPKRNKKEVRKDDEEYIRTMSTIQVIKRLYSYIGVGNRKNIYLFIISVSFNALFSWFTPLIFKIFIDEGLGGGLNATGGDINIIFLAGTLFFIFTISGVCVRIVQNYIIQKLATKTMYNLRSGIFNKLQFLGLDYYDGKDERTGKFRTTGKIISYATNDVNTIQELIGSGLLMVVGNFFLVFGALAFMIILSPHLTLVSFMLLVPIFGVASIIFGKARKYFKKLRERVAAVNSELDESIVGMRIIQSFAVEEENFNEFNEATNNEMQITLKSAKLFASIPGVIILVMTTGIGILIITSGFLLRQGLLTQGIIIAFIFYLFTFFEPIFQLVGFFTLLQNSISACERIIKLLNTEPLITDKEEAIDIYDIKGKIGYRKVNFEYEMNTPILKNIDLTIKEKERLALVGYTGAGKTTFIKLICRFYDSTDGEIYLDDLNLKEIKINSLRKKIGIVLQENFLFSETIMENIRYGKLDATNEEVIEVAKKANAHEFIMDLKDGYNTIVGERGNRLSEGQRQLIAFARALIAEPPILILDEATSSVDPFTELIIQKVIETIFKNRTSISIAHRLSTVINADRIIVLDKGEIIEEGTHDELVKKDGFYNHLYKMQFKDPFKKEKYDEEVKILREAGRLSPQDLDRRRGGFENLF